jgi:hypothetical protein
MLNFLCQFGTFALRAKLAQKKIYLKFNHGLKKKLNRPIPSGRVSTRSLQMESDSLSLGSIYITRSIRPMGIIQPLLNYQQIAISYNIS